MCLETKVTSCRSLYLTYYILASQITFEIFYIILMPLKHFQAALYFGADTVLLKCKYWFSEVALSKGPGLPEIQLDDLIHIWNFGLEHGKIISDV